MRSRDRDRTGYNLRRRERNNELRRMRRRGPIRYVICDYLETFGPATAVVLLARINTRHPDITMDGLCRSLHRLAHRGVVAYNGDWWQLIDMDWLEEAV
jgi:hypothetical protein